METWVIVSIAAAFFQNLRFMLQKSLKTRLTTLGVTFARFVFAAPLAAILAGVLLMQDGVSWPGMTPRFFGFAIIGGLAQIIATALLVALFSLRNFAVGVALSKTETIATALLSALVLGEFVGAGGWLAILVTMAGVLLISGLPRPGALASGIFGRPALIGLGSGAVFSLASVGYRGASLALENGGFMIRASVTLAFVTAFQTLIMALWLGWRQPGQIRAVLKAWPVAIWVGVTGMLGSLGWFVAFTLTNAAYVKAVGQVELAFTVLASWLFFREKITRVELAGIALIVAGILILVLYRA